jgi:hypothetical protein
MAGVRGRTTAAAAAVVGVALALGGPLVVKPGEAALALRTLLGLGGTAFALLGRACTVRCEFALLPGLVVLDPGGLAFAPRPLLGLGHAAFVLLGSPEMLLCGFALASGLVMRRTGDAAFALRALLGLGRLPLSLLGRLLMLLGEHCNLRRALALTRGLLVLLGRLGSVGLGFLAVSGGLAAKPLALAAPVLGRSSGRQHRDGDHDQNSDHDDDHSER